MYANLESAEDVFTVGLNHAVALIAEKAAGGGKSRFQRATFGIGNDRTATGLGFEGDNAKIFFARENEGPTAAIMVMNFFIRKRSKELNVLIGDSCQMVCILPLSDDFQGQVKAIKRLDRKSDFFVGRKSGDDQEEVAFP